MARLGNLELKALSQALLDLYLPGTYPAFPARVVALARRLFSCDNYCYNEFAGNRALRFEHEPAFGGSLEVFNHYVGQHPLAIPLLQERSHIP